ncbi:MAG TPA: MgtC/SapB family protein [Methylovorus sp.]|jgi:putative Mg2+ transporter-C (MgtC) family protein|nr:MgtC/SapB family protein [Methylovorus sp.]
MDSLLNDIMRTLVAEFSDLPNGAEVTRVILRLGIAALLGGLLGYEREFRGKAAGMRTHMLVALGAAMFVLVPIQAGLSESDISRVVQGVIAGVGFLCAGTIIKHGHDGEVHGLTTSAGLWMTAAIGVAAGMGRESTAILSALLAYGILHIVPKLAHQYHQSQAGNKDDIQGQ